MMSGVSAMGDLCMHLTLAQITQHQQMCLRSCSKVGRGPVCAFMGARISLKGVHREAVPMVVQKLAHATSWECLSTAANASAARPWIST